MLAFLRAGGDSMLFLLALGVVTLATAFWFAVRPDRRQLGFLRWMAASIAFATVAGVCEDVSATLHGAGAEAGVPAETRARIVMVGLAESTAPAILGAAFLALVCLLAAVGQRRLDARRDD